MYEWARKDNGSRKMNIAVKNNNNRTKTARIKWQQWFDKRLGGTFEGRLIAKELDLHRWVFKIGKQELQGKIARV